MKDNTMELVSRLLRCQLPPHRRQSLPPELYTDAELLELETNAILLTSWIGIGRADRFKSSGEYEALELAGRSVIVLRDSQGTLRCFANSCRHRGARLLDGSGQCRLIRCPFHSWAYRLDGSLIGAPQMSDLDGFNPAEMGLVEFPVQTSLGFAFINLSTHPEPLEHYLGDMENIHASWPIDVLVSTRRRSFEVNCNWKAFLEVFNEYYHLPYIHADSIGDVYHVPETATTTIGAYAAQYGSTARSGGVLQTSTISPLPSMPGLAESVHKGVIYTWLYPNMTFALGADALWLYEANPLNESRCMVHQTACFPASTVELPEFASKVEAYYDRLDVAIAEDIPALENQHRGLKSGAALQGPFHPLLEANVMAFSKWYADRMLSHLQR